MGKYIVDKIVTRGQESSKQIQYELYANGKFVGSDEKSYPGITEAQIQAFNHIEEHPDTYEHAKNKEFFHYNS